MTQLLQRFVSVPEGFNLSPIKIVLGEFLSMMGLITSLRQGRCGSKISTCLCSTCQQVAQMETTYRKQFTGESIPAPPLFERNSTSGQESFKLHNSPQQVVVRMQIRALLPACVSANIPFIAHTAACGCFISSCLSALSPLAAILCSIRNGAATFSSFYSLGLCVLEEWRDLAL